MRPFKPIEILFYVSYHSTISRDIRAACCGAAAGHVRKTATTTAKIPNNARVKLILTMRTHLRAPFRAHDKTQHCTIAPKLTKSRTH